MLLLDRLDHWGHMTSLEGLHLGMAKVQWNRKQTKNSHQHLRNYKLRSARKC